jgi:cytochrome c-type biogenesis protein CcmE
MKARHKRLLLIAAGLAVLGLSAWLILSAFQQNLLYFYTPTDVTQGKAPTQKNFRLGGMVEKGSIVRLPDGMTVNFVVTDMAQKVPVTYRGILPDLFKEGKGVVTQGKLGADNIFVASEVLAKHDENYMPPEAAYALKKGEAANAAAASQAASNAAPSANPVTSPAAITDATPASKADAMKDGK